MDEQQQQKWWRTSQLRNAVFIVILLVCVTVFYVLQGSTPLTFAFDETCMSITGPQDAPFSVTLDYDDILSVTEITEFDVGNQLSGLDSDKCQFGMWENAEWGEYTLCIIPSFSDFLVFETSDGIIVANYENKNSTQHLYTAIVELLDAKQQAN